MFAVEFNAQGQIIIPNNILKKLVHYMPLQQARNSENMIAFVDNMSL